MAKCDVPSSRLRFLLDQCAITEARTRRSEALAASRPSILRFFRPAPPVGTPVVEGIQPANEFPLSADAIEAGRAALTQQDVVIEQRRGPLRRHTLKSAVVGVVVLGGWFLFL